MKNLIISWDNYSWIKHCSGTIARDPLKYQVIIINRDDQSSIHNCNFLCEDAVFEQRRFDVFKIGKFLGIKKVANLLFDEENTQLDILTIKLQLTIMLSKLDSVICQDHGPLCKIITEIVKRTNTELFLYDTDTTNFNFMLTEDEIKIKCMALKKITGYTNPSTKFVNPINTESFNLIG